MPLTLTITATSEAELFATLKGAAAMVIDEVPAKKPTDSQTNPPITATPSTAPIETASTPQAPVSTYSLNSISRAGAALLDEGKKAELADLLRQFGLASISELQSEQYADFATALRRLGAQI